MTFSLLPGDTPKSACAPWSNPSAASYSTRSTYTKHRSGGASARSTHARTAGRSTPKPVFSSAWLPAFGAPDVCEFESIRVGRVALKVAVDEPLFALMGVGRNRLPAVLTFCGVNLGHDPEPVFDLVGSQCRHAHNNTSTVVYLSRGSRMSPLPLYPLSALRALLEGCR